MRYEDLLNAIIEAEDRKKADARRQLDDARRKKSRAAQKYQDQMRSANQDQSRAVSTLSKPR